MSHSLPFCVCIYYLAFSSASFKAALLLTFLFLSLYIYDLLFFFFGCARVCLTLTQRSCLRIIEYTIEFSLEGRSGEIKAEMAKT